MLFGAVALVGVLGSSVMTTVLGPLTTVTKVTQKNQVETDLQTNIALMGVKMRQLDNGGDIDDDRYFEPDPYRDCSNGLTGGGCIPMDMGAIQTDPWGTPYGYCVWDHGAVTGSTNRLNGSNTSTGPTIALIVAGANKTFETSCHAYDESGIDPDDVDTIIQPAAGGGGDDFVKIFSYESIATSSYIGSQPDEACAADTVGLLRYDMETIQVCNGTGWSEVSGDSFSASGNFDPVTDAILSSTYTSNTITFDNFLGTRTATATGGASIIVNGVDEGTSTSIESGDLIALRATSASQPEVEREFTLSVSAINRRWTITTRDKTPPSLSITPSPSSGMDVAGPGSPAYGSPITFIIRNNGEADSNALSASGLSNLTNFEFFDIGDACDGVILGYNDVCYVEVRPKASGDGALSGTLSVTDGTTFATANLSGTASGWQCGLPWGGTINDGQSTTAYQTSSVPFGSSCNSQTRTCSSGTLSGSYTNPSCSAAAPANCTRPWGGTVSHGSSITAYASSSVPFGSSCNSQTRTCNNGSLSGSYTRSSCSVQPPPCPSVGDVCPDGTINAGSGMYTTPNDGGDRTRNDAVNYCNGLTSYGKTDWYLPSKSELLVLFNNRYAIGGFNLTGTYPDAARWPPKPSGWYIARSGWNGNSGDIVSFSTGSTNGGYYYHKFAVRCVRR